MESTDPLPVGRRPCQSLREKEKVILRDINDGITPYGDNLTVLELIKKYIAQKTGVRHNTAANYNFVINIIKKEEFGALRIDKVKLLDAKAWLIKLQADGRVDLCQYFGHKKLNFSPSITYAERIIS